MTILYFGLEKNKKAWELHAFWIGEQSVCIYEWEKKPKEQDVLKIITTVKTSIILLNEHCSFGSVIKHSDFSFSVGIFLDKEETNK